MRWHLPHAWTLDIPKEEVGAAAGKYKEGCCSSTVHAKLVTIWRWRPLWVTLPLDKSKWPKNLHAGMVSNNVLKGEQDWGHGYILFFFTFLRLLSSAFIFALTWFWHQQLTRFTWRDLVDVKMIIWIHLLSRQPFSRQPVTWKRSWCFKKWSLLGNKLTWKGLTR